MADQATQTRRSVVQQIQSIGLASRFGKPRFRTGSEPIRTMGQRMLKQHSDAGVAPDLEAADLAARHWSWPVAGPLPIGSDAHRDAACRMFFDTFNPYRPSIIDWPLLSDEARARLTGLPIWDIAVQTEGKARLRMQAYAQNAADPAWRDAIERNAWEENRHKEVLSNLVSAYGIALAPEPVYRAPRSSGMGVSGHRILRMYRQFLRFRPVRRGEAIRLLSAGAGRYVRAGDPGRSAAHFVVRQLAGMATPPVAVVAARTVRAAGCRGVAVPRLGARRAGAWHGKRWRDGGQ